LFHNSRFAVACKIETKIIPQGVWRPAGLGITPKHDTGDLLTQPNKRLFFEPDGLINLPVSKCASSQSDALSFASPVKRNRTDGSITVCDKQPRVHEVSGNDTGEDVHSIYFEINQHLGELHFQRQVRELRNRLAAQQSPSKSSS